MIETISVIGSILLGLAGLIIGYITTNKGYKHLVRSEEEKRIIRQLDEFYGPYQHLLDTSRQLYDVLRKGKPKDFRVLLYLLEGNILDKNDEMIFSEILKISDEIEDLRKEKGGLIQNPDLLVLLAKTGTHYRILKSVYQNKLKGNLEEYADFVFPRELNDKLNERIKFLEEQLKELRK